MKLHAIDYAASAIRLGAIPFSGNILNGGATVRTADLRKSQIMGIDLDPNTLPDGETLVIRQRPDGTFRLAH